MTKAKTMFRIDALVFFFCWSAACFYAGTLVGEEQSAAELMPCPKEAGMSIISRTATVCTYQRAYGRATKERRV